VGRRLFRDGTSEYQINNGTARLKGRARSLFLDTGIRPVDAYSVIEQGRVAAMLDANPEERRLISKRRGHLEIQSAEKRSAKPEKGGSELLRRERYWSRKWKAAAKREDPGDQGANFQELSTQLAELRLSYSLQEYHTHSETKRNWKRAGRRRTVRLA